LAILAPLLAAIRAAVADRVHTRTTGSAGQAVDADLRADDSGFLFAFGSMQPAPWMAFAPDRQHMLITDLVRGDAVSLPAAAALSLVTLAAAIGAGGPRRPVEPRSGAAETGA
jgi:hypothetical protein